MTADEWLAANGKSPWESAGHWYWARDRGRCSTDAPGDSDFVLPVELFDRMQGLPTYPDCRRYGTRDAAMDDFRAGFAAAVSAGWVPEPGAA